MLWTYRNAKKIKRIIGRCEIKDCPVTDYHQLDIHHITPQRLKGIDPKYSDDWSNICVLCKLHHADADKGVLIIEGRVKTNLGTELIYSFVRKEV